jgi:hypothetical protein
LAKRLEIRHAHALHAGSLWTVLVELSLRVDAGGGDHTRDGLVEDLREQPFRIEGERRHATTRDRLWLTEL